MDLKQKNKLFFARAGFGISVADFQDPKPVQELVAKMLPSQPPAKIEVVTADEWQAHKPKVMKEMKENGDATAQKEMQRTFREKVKDVNLAWADAMVSTPYPLLEKTALFWHGHFATRVGNPYYDQELLDVIRKNALGSFRTMLKDVSRSSAMLQFLNNQQNKKMHPNENFAREVMELFTLGRGHYTEDDVKEAARAFTGWAYDGDGNFIFRPRQHDDGEKKFLGKTGNFMGDDILNIILEQKQTAIFITQKIYRYFVSDEKIEEKRIKTLAADFYDSDYDIASLLKNIFTADWFYTSEIAGSKIKSPVELLTSYQRMLPYTYLNPKTPLYLQRLLGQSLFNPPNVAGWPGGKNWIDSSSLIIRMRLPEALFAAKELDLSLKDTDIEDNKMAKADRQNSFKVGRVNVNWDHYIEYWQAIPRQQLPEAIASFLFTTPVSAAQLKEVDSYADKDSDSEYIKSLTILLMGLPEYQLT